MPFNPRFLDDIKLGDVYIDPDYPKKQYTIISFNRKKHDITFLSSTSEVTTCNVEVLAILQKVQV